MRRITTTRPTLLFLLLALGLTAAGCSDDSNPTATPGPIDEEPDEILTPVSLKITKVSVSAFGDKNGGNWDLGLAVADRRPDIYMALRAGTEDAGAFYVSTQEENAFSGVRYEFVESAAGVGLPKTTSASRRLYVQLYDEDGASADDAMGSYSFLPLSLYEHDNAAGFYKVFFGTNDTKFAVWGEWVY